MAVLSWNMSDRSCGGLTRADDALVALKYLAFAAFTILRVYAVWGRDWKPLLVVIPLSLARPLLFIAGSVFYMPVQGGPPFGCMRIYTLPDEMMSKYVFETISIVTTVTSEGIFLALTWIRTYGIKRDCSRLGVYAPLTTLLLRDGTAYFAYAKPRQLLQATEQLMINIVSTLFPGKIVAIISDLSAFPSLFLRIWPYFDETLTVCFLCRFMLDLRGVYFSDDMENELDKTMHLSTIHFTSSVVGNLGATLRGRLHHDDLHQDMARDLDSHASTLCCEDDNDDDDELPEFAGDPFKAGIRAPLDVRQCLPC
ncbi:hypothetical protein LXA43DRAFT_510697 [Ganoderma leucocontextum]|nr:hypothetical protein LXA43DRAFT_510697 [Ganoderma leucocontextum]